MSADEELDEIMNGIQDAVENAMTDVVEDLIGNIGDSVQASVQNAIENMLASFDFTLSNGVKVTPVKRLTVTSPDKTRMFVCYGGLKVDGLTLLVQTRVDCWQPIYVYKTQEDAIQALGKVKKAMIDGIDFLDL